MSTARRRAAHEQQIANSFTTATLTHDAILHFKE